MRLGFIDCPGQLPKSGGLKTPLITVSSFLSRVRIPFSPGFFSRGFFQAYLSCVSNCDDLINFVTETFNLGWEDQPRSPGFLTPVFPNLACPLPLIFHWEVISTEIPVLFKSLRQSKCLGSSCRGRYIRSSRSFESIPQGSAGASIYG